MLSMLYENEKKNENSNNKSRNGYTRILDITSSRCFVARTK